MSVAEIDLIRKKSMLIGMSEPPAPFRKLGPDTFANVETARAYTLDEMATYLVELDYKNQAAAAASRGAAAKSAAAAAEAAGKKTESAQAHAQAVASELSAIRTTNLAPSFGAASFSGGVGSRLVPVLILGVLVYGAYAFLRKKNGRASK